jgi:hypothetical protein
MDLPPHAALPLAVKWGILGCGDVCEVRCGSAAVLAQRTGYGR